MKIKKKCVIIGVKNTVFCPFEVNDNTEISKYYNSVELYFLRNSKKNELPKYNSKIKVIDSKLNLFDFFAKIIFSKKFYFTLKTIITTEDNLIEKIKQIILMPRSIIISNKINDNPPDNIHLFWGHYPSLVILNLNNNIKSKISIFLGAYDFRKKLEISKIASKKSEIIFTHTKKRVRQIKNFIKCNKKIVCNYRGINLDQFKFNFRSSDLNKKKYSFCTVGVLEPHKNVEQVIYSFNFIKKKFNKAKLFIIGRGSKEEDLKKIVKNLNIQDSVKFMGWLPKKKLYRILLSTQFYLHFSKVDVLPNSIKEAMYCKCFVLSSKTFAIQELVKHNQNGFLVNPLDLNKTIRIVKYCLENKVAKSIPLAAKVYIKNKFDLKKNIKSFYDQVSK